MRRMLFAAAVFFVFLLQVAVATAVDTVPGKYRLDGSNTVWFIQMSDTHITSNALPYSPKNFEWGISEAFDVIQPAFFVTTGDLTDSTKEQFPFYGEAPRPEEWQEYRETLARNGMAPEFYHDMPGNHDAFGDKNFDYYLQNSMSGRAYGSTQHSWRINLPGGALHFFTVATPSNDGKQWASDNAELTDIELGEIGSFLSSNSDTDFHLAFGHHDFYDLPGGDRLTGMFVDNGVWFYAHGHKHDNGLATGDDHIQRVRINTCGQTGIGNNFALWAVDNGGVTMRMFKAPFDWPVMIITAPTDLYFYEDTLNYHSQAIPHSCTRAPIRALYFDKRLQDGDLKFSIDSGSWVQMTRNPQNPYQWRGYFDVTKLTTGEHSVSVMNFGLHGVTESNRFWVSDKPPCELGEEDIIDMDAGFPDAGNRRDAGANIPDSGYVDAATADAGHDGGAHADSGLADAGTDSGALVADAGVLPEDAGIGTPDAELADGSIDPVADTGVLPDSGNLQGIEVVSGCSCSAVGL